MRMEDERDRRTSAPAPSTDQRATDAQEMPLDPAELFSLVAREANVDRVSLAMRQFLERGGSANFERAVALFVRSARGRGDPIERVLGALQTIADRCEGYPAAGFPERDTPLRQLMLRGVLLAFYGVDVVEREETARDARVRSQLEDEEVSPDA